MPERLSAIESDIQNLSSKAAGILGLLAAADAVPGPALYQQVMRNITELRQKWEEYRQRLSGTLPLIASYDPQVAGSLGIIARDAAALGDQLQAVSLAAWPRYPEVGVSSLRTRGKQMLTSMLLQLESERATVVPLLRRWASLNEETPKAEQLASA